MGQRFGPGGITGKCYRHSLNRTSVLNEDGLRFDDEFIRHKVLDLVGDLALLGCPVLGHIETYKAGHAQHLELMQAIAASPDSWEIVEMKRKGTQTVFDRVTAKSKGRTSILQTDFCLPLLMATI